MTNTTCAWPGCDRTEILARGLCDRDYRRARRRGTLTSFAVTQKHCDTCGEIFPAGKHGKRYCSTPCREIARVEGLAARRSSRLGARSGRVCQHCGGPVPDSRRKDASHCSTTCQQAAWYAAQDADRLRHAARVWAKANPGARNDSDHRRRARKFGAGFESVDRNEIWTRDNGRCAICADDVDPALRHPDPMSGSLDHIVPLARGGPHRASNIQLTHLVCNLRKGVKIALIGTVI